MKEEIKTNSDLLFNEEEYFRNQTSDWESSSPYVFDHPEVEHPMSNNSIDSKDQLCDVWLIFLIIFRAVVNLMKKSLTQYLSSMKITKILPIYQKKWRKKLLSTISWLVFYMRSSVICFRSEKVLIIIRLVIENSSEKLSWIRYTTISNKIKWV